MSRKPYPTDISDSEWDLIKSMIPAEGKRKRGKKREVDMQGSGKRDFLHLACWLLMANDAS
jgi:putative transposase